MHAIVHFDTGSQNSQPHGGFDNRKNTPARSRPDCDIAHVRPNDRPPRASIMPSRRVAAAGAGRV